MRQADLAVIREGVLARAKAGSASSSEAVNVGERGLALAERGWELANEQSDLCTS